jgi:hypothetical protein
MTVFLSIDILNGTISGSADMETQDGNVTEVSVTSYK